MKFVLPVIAASALLLTGCASQIASDVTTFHENVMPAGETIRVVAADAEDNQSLEFRSYANRIGEELRKIGYTPVTESDVVTDLIAEVDFSVEEGPPEVYTDRSRSYSRYHLGFGRYYDPFHYGFYDPFYDPFFARRSMFYDPFFARRSMFYDPFFADPFFGMARFDDEPEVYSVPTYQRTLQLNISEAGGEQERVFEGHVESNGTENSLPEVMPYLITAMFENFPGESGTTKVVTIDRNM